MNWSRTAKNHSGYSRFHITIHFSDFIFEAKLLGFPISVDVIHSAMYTH